MPRFTQLIGLSRYDAWPHAFPGWMRFALIGAGIYNIIWGGLVVLFPLMLFRLLGMEEPNYPELWQCVGMIVGVYGVGYLAAAKDPYTHWPITLVGLLGKVLGPIGFAKALLEERFPIVFGLNILTNDLIWWIPFFLILQGGYRHWQQQDQALTARYQGEVTDTLNSLMSQQGQTLYTLSHETPVALVMLRHSGCTFCRKMLTDIGTQRHAIEEAGLRLAFVHMGEENSETHAFFDHYGLGDYPRFADPERILYKTLGLQRGGLRQLFGVNSFLKGVPALFAGHGVGMLNGDGFQLSGIAIIHQGTLNAVDVHHNAAAQTDILSLYQPRSYS